MCHSNLTIYRNGWSKPAIRLWKWLDRGSNHLWKRQILKQHLMGQALKITRSRALSVYGNGWIEGATIYGNGKY
jgi:hypothetical protein